MVKERVENCSTFSNQIILILTNNCRSLKKYMHCCYSKVLWDQDFLILPLRLFPSITSVPVSPPLSNPLVFISKGRTESRGSGNHLKIVWTVVCIVVSKSRTLSVGSLGSLTWIYYVGCSVLSVLNCGEIHWWLRTHCGVWEVAFGGIWRLGIAYRCMWICT